MKICSSCQCETSKPQTKNPVLCPRCYNKKRKLEGYNKFEINESTIATKHMELDKFR